MQIAMMNSGVEVYDMDYMRGNRRGFQTDRT